MRTRLLNMTRSNLRFSVWRSFVTMATNLPSWSFLWTLLCWSKSQRSYGFLITEELIFWLQNFGIYFHFSASLNAGCQIPGFMWCDTFKILVGKLPFGLKSIDLPDDVPHTFQGKNSSSPPPPSGTPIWWRIWICSRGFQTLCKPNISAKF